MRRARGWPVAALLLLTACEHTAEERAQRLLVARARERNAVVGAAVVVLLVVAARLALAAFAASRPRGPGWVPPRAPRLPGVLAAAALASEAVAMTIFALLGATVGYLAGPTPAPDVGLDGLGIAFWALYAIPFGSIGLLVALLLIGLPHRLPNVATGTYVTAAAVHLLAAFVALSAVGWASGGWAVLVAVGGAEALVACGGFGWAAVVRLRLRRAARRRAPV